MKRKSKRGRKTGVETKLHAQCNSCEEHLTAATEGNFARPVFNAVQNLDFLAFMRKQIAGFAFPNELLAAAGLPPNP